MTVTHSLPVKAVFAPLIIDSSRPANTRIRAMHLSYSKYYVHVFGSPGGVVCEGNYTQSQPPTVTKHTKVVN